MKIPFSHQDLNWYMNMAYEQAYIGYREDEVPIGAVCVNDQFKVLSKSYNVKEKNNNPCGHAEILSIIEATKLKGDWRLNDTFLFVTLEPCSMCLGAMIQARIGGLIFGSYDLKGGSISLNYNLYKDSRLNHNFPIIGGIEHFKCSKILSKFFKERRHTYSPGGLS